MDSLLYELLEQATPIGISVYQQGDDPEYLDFQVFGWPDSSNTIATYSEQLDSMLTSNEQRLRFLQLLETKSRVQRKIRQTTVFGPFTSLSEIIQ